jgi:hypothetical protein
MVTTMAGLAKPCVGEALVENYLCYGDNLGILARVRLHLESGKPNSTWEGVT